MGDRRGPSEAALERCARVRHALLGSGAMTRRELRAATAPMTSGDFDAAVKRNLGAGFVEFAGPREGLLMYVLTKDGQRRATRDLDA